MSIRRLLVLGLLILGPVTPSHAQTQARWNRYPALSPDGSTIVFTYRGDLWRVPASGGTAVALTTHVAHGYLPVWSHDGRHIAFASDRGIRPGAVPVRGGALVGRWARRCG